METLKLLFVPGHFEDFQLPSLGELAEQIEKYVQSAIGANLRERMEQNVKRLPSGILKRFRGLSPGNSLNFTGRLRSSLRLRDTFDV